MMKAVVLKSTGHPISGFELGTAPRPSKESLKPNQLLVKIKATAINPVDYKMAAYNFLIRDPLPIVLGCDMAGVVEAVGTEVDPSAFKVGDLVFGCPGLGTAGFGTFAEYSVIDSGLAMKTTAKFSDEQLSGCGVGMYTAALGLFQRLDLPIPAKDPNTLVLIWGASGSVGAFATQFASVAGYKVIGVCSKRNFDYVKSLGATHLVDYADTDVVKKIKDITHGELRYAFSTISTDSSNLCIQCLAQKPESIVAECAGQPSIDPGQVQVKNALLGVVPYEPVTTKFVYSIRPQIVKWLDEGKVKPTPIKLLKGIENIIPGLQMVSDGKVSGEKVVVSL
mmetsp:Transcript_20447/g.35279  ORF Transcript_20447/g.35279 Transcript_20447/m.35279 type:complete len:337 (+) Transcript_20447:110-1120(+)